VNIKQMTIDDYDAVYALWTASEGVGLRSIDDSQQGIEKFLHRNPTSCFVAVKDDAVVGSILCGHDGRRGYIYHAMVQENLRGNGIGKMLVKACMDALKVEGIHKSALVVYKTNELGNKFWESIGFTLREDLNYRNMSLNERNT